MYRLFNIANKINPRNRLHFLLDVNQIPALHLVN